MKRKFVVAVGLAFLFLTGCSSISVNYDYDSGINFSHYTTYKWLQNKNNKTQKNKNSLNYKRIRNAVNSTLTNKGFKFKKNGRTDFFVIAYSGIKDKIDVTPWGYNYGPRWGMYRRTGLVNYYKEGTLIIDIVDAATKQLVWRGSGTKIINKNYSPQEKSKNIKEVVNKILNNFPPEVSNN